MHVAWQVNFHGMGCQPIFPKYLIYSNRQSTEDAPSLLWFIEKHKNYTDNIIDDWGFLGACSADYYQKYGEGKLTESDKEKFDKISINMFARFQAFNEQLMLINQLNSVIPDIDKSSQLINKISEEIENNDTKMSGNIIEIENLNISI